jgi:adenylosuccinate lyase
VVLPDASITLHYMLVKFTGLVDSLVVDVERMSANLEATNGLIFSQAVLLALIESGLTREDAYRTVQRHAMNAWDGKGHLRDLLADDPEIGIDRDRIDASFSLEMIGETSRVVFERLSKLTL